MKLKLFSLMTVFAGVWLATAAQSPVNMKFGKPTMEEMQMTTFAANPDADAVVLCRLTDVEYTVQTVGYLLDYHEKCRIKVLKPGGARFAKVVVPYQKNMSVGNNITGLRASFMTIPMDRISGNSSFQEQDGSMSEGVFGTDGDESVESIKATAFNLEGNKVVKTTMKKSSIVMKTIDERNYLVEFTVPDVKEGTVIEYEYTIHSQLFWQLRDWYAQCEIPVVYAKLDMNIPNYLIFNIEEHGIQRLVYTCTQGTLRYKVESDPLANLMYVNTNHYVFEGHNLMGLPKDDYVWSAQDYWAGITAELKQYRLRGMNQLDYAKTWEQIDEMVLSSDDLGIHLNDHSPLAKELKEAKIEEMPNQRERVAAVCQLVMSKVKWNGKYDLCPALTSETLKKGEGSNVDINLLLIQSLHDVGVKAAPVMLRSRDLGLLPYNFPSISKLSTYIVGAILPEGGNIYLDASMTNGQWSKVSNQMLPEVLLVNQARMVLKDKKSGWVDLQKESKVEKNTIINARLAADGTLTGKLTTRTVGGETVETDFTKKGQAGDGQISICPFPDKKAENTIDVVMGDFPIDNPFTAATRKMPVEFPHIGSNRIVINITLPEGYAMEGEAKSTTVASFDKGIEGTILTTPSRGRIQMSCQINISKTVHREVDYADLRQIFDMLSKYTSEELIIKKTNN